MKTEKEGGRERVWVYDSSVSLNVEARYTQNKNKKVTKRKQGERRTELQTLLLFKKLTLYWRGTGRER